MATNQTAKSKSNCFTP